jgi:hypothetical protein
MGNELPRFIVWRPCWYGALLSALLTACAGGGHSSPPPKPTVTLSSSPTSVAQGSSAALTWSTTHATSCTASGGWSGNKATSGSVSTGALNATTTYTLTCTGSGGTAAASATVTLTGPSISVSPSPVNVTAAVNASAPTAKVSVTFTGAPATVYFMVSDFTAKGISSVSTPVYTATSGSFTVSFKSPSGLKPATYTDTDTLLLCSDPQCQTVLAKFPLTVKYTVTAASSAPQVTLDSTSLTYQALAIDNSIITTAPDPSAFTFTNFNFPPIVHLSAPTTGGINGLVFTMSDATHGGITFTFRPPAQLGAGTYNTSIDVTVCLDSTCVNPVAGGNFTLTLHYVIGNTATVGGVNGYTITLFPLSATGIAGTSAQNLIYISIPSQATSNPSTIEALNPLTGAATFSAQPIGGPSLTISDDGKYLYVRSVSGVEQVLASNLTASLAIPVTAPAVFSIAVEPGNSQTIAIGGALANGSAFIQIFDGAVARPNEYIDGAYQYFDFLVWGNSSVLYGSYYPYMLAGPWGECSFPVDANGVYALTSCGGDTEGGNGYNFANSLAYGDGQILDPATHWTLVSRLSEPNLTFSGVVLPDTTLGKIFAFATNSTIATGCSIQSFNLTSLTPIANIHFPSDSAGNCLASNLLRWGPNGLAALAGVGVIVIRGAFVGP